MKKWMILLFMLATVVQARTISPLLDRDEMPTYQDSPLAVGQGNKIFSFPVREIIPGSNMAVDSRGEQSKMFGSQGNFVDAGLPVLFVAEWCGYCKQAKAYLAEKKIRYREYDVGTVEGRRAFIEAGASRGIPVLFLNGQRIQGFSRQAYDTVFGSL